MRYNKITTAWIKKHFWKETFSPNLWNEHQRAGCMMWTAPVCQQELSEPIHTDVSRWLKVRKKGFIHFSDRFLHVQCAHFTKNLWDQAGKKRTKTKTDKLHACTHTTVREHIRFCANRSPDLTQTHHLHQILLHTRRCPAGQATSCSTCSTKTERTLKYQHTVQKYQQRGMLKIHTHEQTSHTNTCD